MCVYTVYILFEFSKSVCTNRVLHQTRNVHFVNLEFVVIIFVSYNTHKHWSQHRFTWQYFLIFYKNSDKCTCLQYFEDATGYNLDTLKKVVWKVQTDNDDILESFYILQVNVIHDPWYTSICKFIQNNARPLEWSRAPSFTSHQSLHPSDSSMSYTAV